MRKAPLRSHRPPRAAARIARVLLSPLALAACSTRPAPAASSVPPPIALAMVRVPDGTFSMGASDGDDDERPAHTIHVAAFDIGKTEVTVAQYRACEAAGACSKTPPDNFCNEPEPGRDAHPVNCVTWSQAAGFCAWAGGRLPTEAEWEYAARGTDGRKYPWGSAPPSAQRLCWDGRDSDLGLGKRRGTCPVGAHSAGASPFGAQDLAGNLWEWTNDFYTQGYSTWRRGPKRVVRGGTWYTYDPADIRATLRLPMRADKADYGVGFRCAR